MLLLLRWRWCRRRGDRVAEVRARWDVNLRGDGRRRYGGAWISVHAETERRSVKDIPRVLPLLIFFWRSGNTAGDGSLGNVFSVMERAIDERRRSEEPGGIWGTGVLSTSGEGREGMRRLSFGRRKQCTRSRHGGTTARRTCPMSQSDTPSLSLDIEVHCSAYTYSVNGQSMSQKCLRGVHCGDVSDARSVKIFSVARHRCICSARRSDFDSLLAKSIDTCGGPGAGANTNQASPRQFPPS